MKFGRRPRRVSRRTIRQWSKFLDMIAAHTPQYQTSSAR